MRCSRGDPRTTRRCFGASDARRLRGRRNHCRFCFLVPERPFSAETCPKKLRAQLPPIFLPIVSHFLSFLTFPAISGKHYDGYNCHHKHWAGQQRKATGISAPRQSGKQARAGGALRGGGGGTAEARWRWRHHRWRRRPRFAPGESISSQETWVEARVVPKLRMARKHRAREGRLVGRIHADRLPRCGRSRSARRACVCGRAVSVDEACNEKQVQ